MSSESPSSLPTATQRHHQPVRGQLHASHATEIDNNNNNNNNINININGRQLIPAANNLAGISIDTSSNVADTKQLDSGSNQSGSDSGLGCTNSVSSDNSTSNAIVQDQSNTNGSETTNNDTENNKGASINPITSRLLSHKRDDTVSSKSDPGSLETRTGLDEMTKSKQTPALSPKSKGDQRTSNVNNTADSQGVACSSSGCNDNGGQARETGARMVQDELRQPPGVRAMKSLLKKTTSSQKPAAKHNRVVTFNQTVIVFCEEIDTSSSTEQFDPPLGYHDPVAAFEPPEDYCDLKADDKDGDVDVANVGSGGITLSDGQLIGLLNNESLLETFKLNCEDFSEDDFPINNLSSGNSYLCNDAISDYDSDSESSLYADQKGSVDNTVQVSSSRDRVGSNLSPSSNKQKCAENNEPIVNKEIVEERRTVSELIECHNRRSINCVKPCVPQKPSMPARMKVTTVDSSHKKQHPSIRKESDLKNSKSELIFNCKSASETTTAHKPETNQRSAMLIKQTTVEPVAVSKPEYVAGFSTGNDNLSHNHHHNSNEACNTTAANEHLVTQPMLKPNDLIRDNNSKNRVLHEVIPSFQQPTNNQYQKSQQNQPTNLETSQLRVGPENAACHMCRVIESSTNSRSLDYKAMNSRKELTRILPMNQSQSLPMVQLVANAATSSPMVPQVASSTQNQPIVFNQSCISCRESCIKQQNLVQSSVQAAGNAPTNATHQPIRQPVAYQFVYVVDQRGNRIRALSVMRPPSSQNPTSTSQSLVGRQIFLTQNGIRYPNPVSITAGQQATANSSISLTQARLGDQRSHGENAQHPNTAQLQSDISQPLHVICGQPIDTQLIGGNKLIPASQEVPSGSHGLRQHTVYYVRHPLGVQTLRHSLNTSDPCQRAFPDPHEVRRLDGLRGPTLMHESEVEQLAQVQMQHKAMTLGSVAGQQSVGVMPSKLRETGQNDDMDDPTFGFSRRPAVKVVATNASRSVNQLRCRNVGVLQNASKDQYFTTLQDNNLSMNRLDRTMPTSLVTGGSQTLDRRNMSQQHVQFMKENISSTSSMSNIHGTLQHMNKASSNNSSQQQKISNSAMTDPLYRAQNKAKDSTNNSGLSQYNLSRAGDNALITNGRSVILPNFGQQATGLTGDTKTSPNQMQMKKATQEQQIELAYSMNV